MCSGLRAITNTKLTSSLAGAAAFLLAVCLSVAPAWATRHSAELQSAVKRAFGDAKFRIDGALESKGELYLPVLPKVNSKGKVSLVETVPAQGNHDFFIFDDGVIFIRVLAKTKDSERTFPSLNALPEKTKKILLSGHLPSDLIVPEGFALPAALKPLVGDLAIATLEEKKPPAVATVKHHRQHKSGAIFISSRVSGGVAVVDDTTLKKVSEFPTEGTPSGMVYVDGKIYIADQSKNRLLILDTIEKRFIGQVDLLPKAAPKAVVSLPEGRLLYVSESGSADIAVVEVATGKVLLRTKVPVGPSRMAITNNGNTILVLNVTTGQVTFISTLNQRVLGTIQVGVNPSAVVIAPDGKTAYVACRGSNYIAVIDVVKRGISANIKTGTGPTGLAISPDGSKLFAAIAKENLISVFETATRKSVAEVKLPLDVDFPGALAFLPDGKRLVVSSASTSNIGILDTEKLEFQCQPEIGHGSDEVLWAPVD